VSEEREFMCQNHNLWDALESSSHPDNRMMKRREFGTFMRFSEGKDHSQHSIADELASSGLHTTYSQNETCKICKANASLFGVVDFNKTCNEGHYPFGVLGVPIYYHRCQNCQFVFTRAFDAVEGAFWGNFIYNETYYKLLDPEYQLSRPKLSAELVHAVCSFMGRSDVVGLDFGGGNGAMAKILSGQGINYFTHDPYGASNLKEADFRKFNVVSAFEVLEHTTDPLVTFEEMLRFVAKGFVGVISTQCSDGLIDEKKRLSWHYVAPRNGHVSIYSQKSLDVLAKAFSINHVAVSRGTHVFGKNANLGLIKYVIGWVKLRQRWRSKLRRLGGC
jgi:hypothetical protein